MRFRVEREALGEAVAWVARALPARPVIPVLSGLLVQAGDAGLTLSCFDYEVSARVAVPAEVDEPGTALVPGRLLAEITRSLPPQPVEFSSAADMVRVACGSAEFELVSLPAQEYPGLPQPPAPAGTVDGGVLAAAAAQVVPSASRDDTLPMLTGVCLDVSGTAITFAATDRYRLAVRTVDWTPAVPGMRAAALVPARTLADVARTMSPGVPVTIAFSVPDSGAAEPAGAAAAAEPRPAEGMISFEGGGRRLTARLIGGDFIRYRSRFPAEFGCRAELPAEQFMAAVRRVSLVAERASPVQLTFGRDEVVIEAHTDGRARAAESVRAAFAGSEPVISFNPGYLLDGLAAAAVCGTARPPAPASDAGAPEPEPGRIRLEFTSPAKPALITWAGYEPDPATARHSGSAAGPPESEGDRPAGPREPEGDASAAQPRPAGEPAAAQPGPASEPAGAHPRSAAEPAASEPGSADDPATGPGELAGREGDGAVVSAAEVEALEDTGGQGTPMFRYLVVPLRSVAGQ